MTRTAVSKAVYVETERADEFGKKQILNDLNKRDRRIQIVTSPATTQPTISLSSGIGFARPMENDFDECRHFPQDPLADEY